MWSISQILEGWRNKLIPPSSMKELIESTYQERMEVCKNCPFFSENRKRLTDWTTPRLDEHCTKCGCTLSAKLRCLSCECPDKKWSAICSSEEFEQINNELNEQNKKDSH